MEVVESTVSEVAVPLGAPESTDDAYEVEFQVGDVVDVMRRMWPGINKPGGVARITKIRFDEGKIILSI